MQLLCPSAAPRLAAATSLTLIGAVSATASATDISLASTMDPTGRLTETVVTGSYAQINLDPDGLYSAVNDSPFGSITLFPNDVNFTVGSFSVDDTTITGTGVEIAPITGLDLSGFSGSATSDISSTGLGLWFFGAPAGFSFGPFDATDTATFTDGLLTSIDIAVDSTFTTFDTAANPVNIPGTLTISGDEITFAYIGSAPFDTGFFGVVPFTFFSTELTGTVDAVGTFVIPEPATAALLLATAPALLARRRASAAGRVTG